jgi:predicted nucleotidyltransferase
MTADQLARHVGITENAVRKLEAGDIMEPRFSTGLRIAEALDAQPESLTRGGRTIGRRASSIDLADTIRAVRSRRGDLERNGVAHVSIFGSVARGDASEASDVDLIVEPTRPRAFSLVDLQRVRTLLAEALGGPIDLFTSETIRRSNFAREATQDAVDAF